MDFIKENDFVAIKSHFGEIKNHKCVAPIYLKTIGNAVKRLKGEPFLTETSTLYRGSRSNAITHIHQIQNNGFDYESTALPVILSDGLHGEDGSDVHVRGEIFDKVNIASIILRCDAAIIVSHFTGHMLAGFGGAIKNLGMGCSSKMGKIAQHSETKPEIESDKCQRCLQCVKECPVDAIYLSGDSFKINPAKCIGCGQCVTLCHFDAVVFDWSHSYETFQRRLIEYAYGVYCAKKENILFLNFLIHISRNCDCMKNYKQIAPDIGILISKDPVAIDKASIDLIEQKTGKMFTKLAFPIPYNFQFEHAERLGFCDTSYELLKFEGKTVYAS